MASPSNDNTVRLWNVETGRLLDTLEHPSTVVCVGWSPDSGMVAVGGGHQDKKVYLWDSATRTRIKALEGHTNIINEVAWAPDGTILASCSRDNTVRLWDGATGRRLRQLTGHSEDVFSLVWSPDSRRLCSGSWDNTVKLWDVNAGKEIRTLKGHKDDVNTVAWSPTGGHIASGSDDQTVRIWDAKTGQQQYVLEGHTDRVVSVSFLDSGRLLSSLGMNGTVIFWPTDSWAEAARTDLQGDNYWLCNLAYHPTLPLFSAASENLNDIDIWGLNLAVLRVAEQAIPTVFYVNAKAVLLGDSGVGKSGLGIRIADRKFRNTESTHGAQFWHFPTERLPSLENSTAYFH